MFIPAALGSLITGGGSAAAAATGASASGLGLGSAMAIGGTALAGISGFEQASRSNAAARYNAAAAQAESTSTVQSGIMAEQQQRMKTAQTIGQATAAYGASGVDTGSGTPQLVNAQTAQMGEFDALTTRANTLNRANFLQTQSQGYMNSRVSPFLTGTTDMLSTASKFI